MEGEEEKNDDKKVTRQNEGSLKTRKCECVLRKKENSQRKKGKGKERRK